MIIKKKNIYKYINIKIYIKKLRNMLKFTKNINIVIQIKKNFIFNQSYFSLKKNKFEHYLYVF